MKRSTSRRGEYSSARSCCAVCCCGLRFDVESVCAGVLTGTIHDATGSAVANAEVTLTETASQSKYHTTANSAGEYSFPAVQVGNYKIEVSAAASRNTFSRESRYR